MSTNFYKMQKDFILNEGGIPTPDMNAYLQQIEEAINAVTPRSHTDARRLSVARESLKNLRRYGRRLQQENSELKEKLKVLEESE